jgi:hypothetical protein
MLLLESYATLHHVKMFCLESKTMKAFQNKC